jgi:uncharacterized protein (TIGR00369 family)
MVAVEHFALLAMEYVDGFPRFCGIEVRTVNPGVFSSRLILRPEHTFYGGKVVHAGVIATMADHTAGYAANTLLDSNLRVVTLEFKISFLGTAEGAWLVCRSRVLKPGKTIIFAESEVFDTAEDGRMLAKASVSLTPVPVPGSGGNGTSLRPHARKKAA